MTGTVRITLPWINFDLINLVKKGDLISRKTFHVKKQVYKLLTAYMAANDANLNQLQAYAQSLGLTTDTSVDNITSTYQLDV